MATLRDKNVKKRVNLPQVPTVPSDGMLASFGHGQNMLIQKKMIDSLPNEMLQTILDKLEMDELIGIRRVCSRWQGVAEDICSKKRSIMIESKAKNLPGPDWSRSFNGLVDFSKDWIILKVKPIKNRRNVIALSSDFCNLLAKLFPEVENLVLNASLQRTMETTDNLFTLLKNWSSTLVALSLGASLSSMLNNFIGKSRYDELFDHINNLTNLKRFVFGESLKPTYKLDFLNRLKHWTFSEGYCDLHYTVPLLTNKCTSVRLFGDIYLYQITRFLKLNAPLVKGLTHLGLTYQHEVLSFICGDFGALQMLDIEFRFQDFNAVIISDLARLSKLTQLSIHDIKFKYQNLYSHYLYFHCLITI